MPCKHTYHFDCLLSSLALRNACPISCHELLTDACNRENLVDSAKGEDEQSVNGEETVGLTIWWFQGGGFAVGKLSERM